jgi:hypothetical protein
MSRGALACRAEGLGFRTKEYHVLSVFEIPN